MSKLSVLILIKFRYLYHFADTNKALVNESRLNFILYIWDPIEPIKLDDVFEMKSVEYLYRIFHFILNSGVASLRRKQRSPSPKI